MKISGIWNAVASQQNKMKKILYFFIWHFLAIFLPQDSNHLIKYSKILVCTYFQINENSYRTQSSNLTILGQETVKIYKKNIENCQNPNNLIKFSEISYVVASTKYNSTKSQFFILTFFGLFGQKQLKTVKIQTI